MKKVLLTWLPIILIALLVWAFKTFYESYDKEVHSGYSIEARKNPFLAAQLFLQRNNVNVIEKTDVLDFSLIGTNETVFLSNVDDMILTQSQIDKALDWVDSGGFLIVGVGDEIQGNASILERFDIDPIEYIDDNDNYLIDDGEFKPLSQRLRELNEEIDERNENGEPAEEDVSFEELLVSDFQKDATYYQVSLGDDVGELNLQVVDNIVLNHPQVGEQYDDEYVSGNYEDTYDLSAQVSDAKGARVLQFHYGQGTFTALSSSVMWETDLIGEADHAFFLAYFVPENATIRFFYNVISPSLSSLLKHYFSESILIVFVLLMLWLWRSSLRVQGIKNEVTSQRRAFSEHLKASADFLLAKEQYSLLLTPIHSDINNGMRLLYPGYLDMAQAKQISLISTTTKLPIETIEAWFEALKNVEDQEQIIATIKVGNVIRNKI